MISQAQELAMKKAAQYTVDRMKILPVTPPA
jgi:hypothetical protein